MSSSTTIESYLATLRRSGLVEDDQLEKLLRDLQAAHGDAAAVSSGILSKKLLDEDVLTSWQHDKIAQGKHKGFFLGKYKLLSHLGTGGMSSVYLGEHTLMRRRVAIKVLPTTLVDDSSYLDRFHREARAIAQLDHPNIVRAYNVDNEGKVHYIVMEYVEGMDLERFVKSRKQGLPYEEAVEYIRQAASGLEHAHGRKMIHRDIKPSNLLRDKTGTVKILDMGLARLTGKDERALTIEHNETVLGTTDYLAPEQAINSHNVDHRADIYALGCSLYFLLTAHPPFPEGTLAQRLMKHQTEEPESILVTRPDCPDDLIDIVQKMTRKKAQDRYQTAGEAEQALADWLKSNGYAVGGSAGVGSSTLARATDADSTMNVRTRPAGKSKIRTPAPPPRVTTPESGAGRSDAELRGFLTQVGQEQETASVLETRAGAGSSKLGQNAVRGGSSVSGKPGPARKPGVPVWVYGAAIGGGVLLLLLAMLMIPSSEPTAVKKKNGQKSSVSPAVTKKLNPRGERSFVAFSGIPFGNRHTLSFDVPTGGPRALSLKVSSGPPNAWAKVLLDGREIAPALEMGDLTTGVVHTFSLGNHTLTAGSHDLVVELDARPVPVNSPDWVTYEPWFLLGPFNRDFNKAYPPETMGFQPNREYTGKGGAKFKWVQKDFANGVVHDLLPHLQPNENISYYLGRKVIAARDGSLNIYVGSDDSIKVFINNQQAHANQTDRGAEPYSDSTSVQLKQGDNFLLLKIGQGAGGTGFFYTDTPDPNAVSALPFEFGLEYPAR